MDLDTFPSLPEAGNVVRDVRIRPVGASERTRWDTLMAEHHYLGFQGMIGESLRYVAVYRDRWLALLGWSSAALKCKARDEWIGWTPALKLQRLPLMANNCRFLILPPCLRAKSCFPNPLPQSQALVPGLAGKLRPSHLHCRDVRRSTFLSRDLLPSRRMAVPRPNPRLCQSSRNLHPPRIHQVSLCPTASAKGPPKIVRPLRAHGT